MLVQRFFQPPPRPTLRVVGGHVVLALARHGEARLLQGGDDAGPVLHRAARSGPGGHPEGLSGAEDGGAVDAPGVLQLSGVFQVVMGDHLPHDLA